MSATELKPCPFCGAQPKIRTESLDERFAYANEVIVQCPSCGCRQSAVGDTSKPGYADNSTTERRAIETWNRRTELAAGAAAGGETNQNSSSKSSINCTAPAAGTEKDAERYRYLRHKHELLPMSWVLDIPSGEDLDNALDSLIVAHTKAGKED